MKRATVPRPTPLWSVNDVLRWLKRRLFDMHALYAALFVDHAICGAALVRLTPERLENMGVANEQHRNDIYREIAKLRLNWDLLEIRSVYSGEDGGAFV